MQYWRSLPQASPRIVAECRKLLMMTGRIALSSKLPCDPANAIVESSDSTWMQTMTMASHWVGLTLPGMIEDPGSLAGAADLDHPGPLAGLGRDGLLQRSHRGGRAAAWSRHDAHVPLRARQHDDVRRHLGQGRQGFPPRQPVAARGTQPRHTRLQDGASGTDRQ